MSQNIRKQVPSFSRFLVNLVRTGPPAQGVEHMNRARITMMDLAALSKHTQLLVAYCLDENNPNLTLLAGDSDIDELVSAGWMISVPCSTVGIRCSKFMPSVWQQLRSIKWQFVKNNLAADLLAYKRNKSLCYPWNW